jgi:hypothetical protein
MMSKQPNPARDGCEKPVGPGINKLITLGRFGEVPPEMYVDAENTSSRARPPLLVETYLPLARICFVRRAGGVRREPLSSRKRVE